MPSNGGTKATIGFVFYFSVLCFQANTTLEVTRDQTTSRANTLFDDADDIQRQLDNEAREKYGQFKTEWVFHISPRNSFQTFTHTTPLINAITVRLKRKINKTRFKSFYKSPDKKKQRNCGNSYNEKSVEECECPMCKSSGNAKKKDPQIALISSTTEPTDDASTLQDVNQTEPEWTFWDQNHWHKKFKDCGGRAQSPVVLPVAGLITVKGARKLTFLNYDVKPCNLTVVNDGNRVVMYGTWPKMKWPLIYGGAAYSRRYLFHSLSVYWPSEHQIGGIYYPMETQLLHISSEYGSYDEAIAASSRDPLAFLGVINIYKFAETSHPGVIAILQAARKCHSQSINIPPVSLDYFSKPFSDHVCYYGSLTIPPCTESVLWLVRRRSLPLTREASHSLQDIIGGILRPPQNPVSETGGEYRRMSIRMTQPLNDRKVYVFMDTD